MSIAKKSVKWLVAAILVFALVLTAVIAVGSVATAQAENDPLEVIVVANTATVNGGYPLYTYSAENTINVVVDYYVEMPAASESPTNLLVAPFIKIGDDYIRPTSVTANVGELATGYDEFIAGDYDAFFIYFDATPDSGINGSGAIIENKALFSASFTLSNPAAGVYEFVLESELEAVYTNGDTKADEYGLTVVKDNNYTEKSGKFIVANFVDVPAPETTSFVYNGEERTVFTETANYTVTNNVKTNAGNYTATATLKSASSVWRIPNDNSGYTYSWESDYAVDWAITPQPVAVPVAAQDLVFDGDTKVALVGTDAYNVTNGSARDAGNNYVATASLKSGNYVWDVEDPEQKTTDKSVPYSIAVRVIDVPTANGPYTYDGTEKTGVAQGNFFGFVNEGDYTNKATAAGTYQAKLAIAETNNVHWNDEDPTGDKVVEWIINKATRILTVEADDVVYGDTIAVSTSGTSVVFGATPVEDAEQVVDTQWSTDGENWTEDVPVNVGSYSVKVTISSKNYTTVSATDTFAITRATIDYPTAVTGLVYNGETQTGVVAGTGYTLSEQYTGINAGSYVAKANVDANHVWSNGTDDEYSINWSISPKSASLSIADASSVFGETPTAPTISYSGFVGEDAAGLNATVSGVPSAGAAAGSYPMTINYVNNTNYDISVTNATYEITKATASYPTAVGNLIYNGQEQTGVVAGTGYTLTGNKGTAASDNYAATATLDANHTWTGGATAEYVVFWSIAPKAASITVGNGTSAYGETPTTPGITYAGFLNGDENNLGASVTGMPTASSNVGSYDLSATYTANSNYSITLTGGSYTITSAQIAVPTAVGNLVYNGQEQTGVADPAENAGYTLTGNKGTNAGGYTATATLDGNHAWVGGSTENASIEWSIGKAANTITISGPSSIVYGNAITIGTSDTTFTYTATNTSGLTIDWFVWEDEDWNTLTGAPTNVGNYKVQVYALASQNYYAGLEDKEFSITRAEIAVPTAVTGLVYNGSTKTGVADPAENAGYTISGNKAINAGDYVATATLDGNHAWTGGATAEYMVFWSIAKADQTVTVAYKGNNGSRDYNGAALALDVEFEVTSDTFGTLQIVTAASDVNTQTAAPAMIDVDDYSFRVYAPGNSNYNPAISDVVTFEITPADVNVYLQAKMGDTIVYLTYDAVNGYTEVNEATATTITMGDALPDAPAFRYVYTHGYKLGNALFDRTVQYTDADSVFTATYALNVGIGDMNGDKKVTTQDLVSMAKLALNRPAGQLIEVTIPDEPEDPEDPDEVAAYNTAYQTGVVDVVWELRNDNSATYGYTFSNATDVNRDGEFSTSDIVAMRQALATGYTYKIITNFERGQVTGQFISNMARVEVDEYEELVDAVMSGLPVILVGNIEAPYDIFANIDFKEIGDNNGFFVYNVNVDIDLGGYTLTVNSFNLNNTSADAILKVANGTIYTVEGISITAPNGNVMLNDVNGYNYEGTSVNLAAASSSLHMDGDVAFYLYKIADLDVAQASAALVQSTGIEDYVDNDPNQVETYTFAEIVANRIEKTTARLQRAEEIKADDVNYATEQEKLEALDELNVKKSPVNVPVDTHVVVEEQANLVVENITIVAAASDTVTPATNFSIEIKNADAEVVKLDVSKEVEENTQVYVVSNVTVAGENSKVEIIESANTVTRVDCEAKIGDTNYNTWLEAFAAAKNGDTIKLLKDVASTSNITFNKDVILDLNDFAMNVNTGAAARSISIAAGSTVTFKNGTINNNNEASYGLIENRGIFIMDDVELNEYGHDDGAALRSWSGSTMIVTNSTLKSLRDVTGKIGNQLIRTQREGNSRAEISLTVEDTTLTSISTRAYPLDVRAETTAVFNRINVSGVHGAIALNGGNVTINESSFANSDVTAQNYYAVWITNDFDYTNVTINSGNFVGGKNAVRIARDDKKQDTSDINVAIYGGNYSATHEESIYINTTSSHIFTLTIYGGTFTEDPSAYVAEGYQALSIGNDTWTVVESNESTPVYIGNVGYATLQAAISAAESGDTIVLAADITDGSGITTKDCEPRTFTIDFNGKTYTVVGPGVGSTGTETQAMHWSENSVVTLKNGTFVITTEAATVEGSNGKLIKMALQNYADLTIEDMVFDFSNLVVREYPTDKPATYGEWGGLEIPLFNHNKGTMYLDNVTMTMPTGSTKGLLSEKSGVTIKDSTINGYVSLGHNGEVELINSTVTNDVVPYFDTDIVTETSGLYTVLSTIIRSRADWNAVVAAGGSKIILGQDININPYSLTYDGAADLTVDLNGHALSNKSTVVLALGSSTNASITIIDSVGGGSISSGSSSGYAVRNGSSTGALNIYGGSFNAAYAAAYSSAGSGSINIYGGTFTATATGKYAIMTHADSNGVINVYGGNFSSDVAAQNNGTGSINIYGGTFDHDPTAYVPAGYGITENDGTYTVAALTTPVCIGNVGYATLQAAIDAIPDNGSATITLLADITDGTGIEVPDGTVKEITIDFNGKTYTMTNAPVGSTKTKNQAMHWSTGSTVTLKNGNFIIAENVEGLLLAMQNYSALTIDNMLLDASEMDIAYYAASYGALYGNHERGFWGSNNVAGASLTIVDSTIKMPDGATCGVTVEGIATITDSTIEGTVTLSTDCTVSQVTVVNSVITEGVVAYFAGDIISENEGVYTISKA